ELTPGDLEGLLRRRRVIGLAEMMNFPGVIGGDEGELAKLRLDGAEHVDGHAPGVLGKALNAYAAAGIRSDHEMSTIEEGRERLRAGMWVLIREASGARNLHALLPLVHEFGPHRLAFCTDDREPEHIAEEGHVNSMVREAVAAGVSPEDALVMATFNPAQWHGLRELGALAPGYQADVLVLPDLERFLPELVLKAGRPVAEIPRLEVPEWVRHTVRIRPLSTNDFTVPWEGDGGARVIGIVPDQIVTESLVDEPRVEGAKAVSDPERDLLKIAVVERHLGTGRVGLGFVRGFGLRSGALASTVAHDAHNVVVVGVKDDDMLRAVRRLSDTGGGVVVVDSGIVKAELKLPIAGLLSDASLDEVIAASRACVQAAHSLGCDLPSPFQTMAFLALSVIPSLKITDRGLVDVDRFELVPLQT
ncbi:MAG TPA: adenine deaminase C-terminal domain-containing protein, partial [Gaiellaceae bacterium]